MQDLCTMHKQKKEQRDGGKAASERETEGEGEGRKEGERKTDGCT